LIRFNIGDIFPEKNRKVVKLMKKQIICVVMVIGILFGMNTPTAFAAPSPMTSNQVGVQWATTDAIALSLDFSGGKANASGNIQGKSNVTKIDATFSLKEKGSDGSFTTKHTWPSVSTTDKTLRFSGSTSATSGKTYRLYVTATVTSSSGSEVITYYVEKTY